MKRITISLILVAAFALTSAAKKDLNAWKKEENLKNQYEVFKTNLNFWNGSYFLKPPQLDEFYKALTDSMAGFESELNSNRQEMTSLRTDLNARIKEAEDTQKKLDETIRQQNSIKLLGFWVQKNSYSLIMTSLIVGLLVVLGIVFLMFKRSNRITVNTKREYEELKEEFEVHKKNSLDRYTKMNMELHRTRMELKKK